MTENDSSSSDTTTAPRPQDRTVAPGRGICDFESIGYEPDGDAVRARYSPAEASPSEAVVSAVAAASDTDPLDLHPLHARVDADALDTLVAPAHGAGADLRVTFEFHGYEVTASRPGTLLVRPIRPPASSGDADR